MRVLAVAASILVLACANQPVDRPAAAAGAETAVARATANTSRGAEMDLFGMPANPRSTSSGLQYVIDQPGSGLQPAAGQTVSVHYTGWLPDGTKFDSSRDRNKPFEFALGRDRSSRAGMKGWLP